MSKVGRKPIIVPKEVKVNIESAPQGWRVSVQGAKGSLTHTVEKDFNVSFSNQELVVAPNTEHPSGEQKARWGLHRSLLHNMVLGVTSGFEKRLEIEGIGFKATVIGNKLVLNIGFSHPVELTMPHGIEAKVEKNVIIISGINKHLVGQVAADIRAQKPPEPYKGKGIKYKDEVITRKAGKKAATSTG